MEEKGGAEDSAETKLIKSLQFGFSWHPGKGARCE
jgi:hypothetical protein